QCPALRHPGHEGGDGLHHRPALPRLPQGPRRCRDHPCGVARRLPRPARADPLVVSGAGWDASAMTTDASMQDSPTPVGAVVAAVDGSHRDPAVLDWAASEAAAVGASLHLVHAVDLGTPLSAYGELLTSPDIVDKVEQESVRVATQARERVIAAQPDLPVTVALPTGAPAGGLLNAADG